MELMSFFLLPCFMAEAGYKIWWYISAAKEIPYYTNNMYISYITSCTLELCSWLYRTSIFFFVCILFRLICRLQMIRLEDFASVFRRETEVGTILMQHLGLRRTFTIISHRFRAFILLSLILVTASQFISLLMTTRSKAHVNLSKAGQLAVIIYFLNLSRTRLNYCMWFLSRVIWLIYENRCRNMNLFMLVSLVV